MRASDADRDRGADALREHHAAGRIDDAELEERLAVILAARTLEEIAVPFADLTPPPVGPPRQAESIRVGGFGLREFRQRHVLPCDRPTAWRQVMANIAPAMSAYGYTVVDRHQPDYLVFEIHEGSTPTRVVVALTEPATDQTELVVTGSARRRVRKAFAGISASG